MRGVARALRPAAEASITPPPAFAIARRALEFQNVMRRSLLLAYALITGLSLISSGPAFAQYGGGGGGGRGGAGAGAGGDDSSDDAARKKRDDEWSTGANLDLPGKRNAGPCPFVKVLYDASRYVEFKDDKVASSAVGYTGEIQNLSSGCVYTGTDPIHVEAELLFAFGRGPQASEANHTYRYWVAVTDRNMGVIAKEYFDVEAKFPQGEDRVLVTDRINGITIPRADANVSGANFEVLIGFDVTPQMADFNRMGKRFRVNAGSPAAQASSAPAAQP